MADNQSPKPIEVKKSPIPWPRWAWILAAIVAGFLLMTVFNKTVPAPNSAPVPAAEPIGTEAAPAETPLPTDAWVGTWTGVEGLRIDIEKTGASYKLHIVNMDGEGDFTGMADGETIVFERAGKTERLTHGDGKATGLKWLADKTNCLVIAPGEGFCRPEGNP